MEDDRKRFLSSKVSLTEHVRRTFSEDPTHSLIASVKEVDEINWSDLEKNINSGQRSEYTEDPHNKEKIALAGRFREVVGRDAERAIRLLLEFDPTQIKDVQESAKNLASKMLKDKQNSTPAIYNIYEQLDIPGDLRNLLVLYTEKQGESVPFSERVVSGWAGAMVPRGTERENREQITYKRSLLEALERLEKNNKQEYDAIQNGIRDADSSLLEYARKVAILDGKNEGGTLLTGIFSTNPAQFTSLEEKIEQFAQRAIPFLKTGWLARQTAEEPEESAIRKSAEQHFANVAGTVERFIAALKQGSLGFSLENMPSQFVIAEKILAAYKETDAKKSKDPVKRYEKLYKSKNADAFYIFLTNALLKLNLAQFHTDLMRLYPQRFCKPLFDYEAPRNYTDLKGLWIMKDKSRNPVTTDLNVLLSMLISGGTMTGKTQWGMAVPKAMYMGFAGGPIPCAKAVSVLYDAIVPYVIKRSNHTRMSKNQHELDTCITIDQDSKYNGNKKTLLFIDEIGDGSSERQTAQGAKFNKAMFDRPNLTVVATTHVRSVAEILGKFVSLFDVQAIQKEDQFDLTRKLTPVQDVDQSPWLGNTPEQIGYQGSYSSWYFDENQKALIAKKK